MQEIVNTQQKRLYDALVSQSGEQVANDIACFEVLPKNPSAAKKAAWAARACEELERQMDADTVKHVRMACHCKPPQAKFASIKRAYARSKSVEEYVQLMDAQNQGAHFWTEDGDVFMSYPRCYCSFVSDAKTPLPASWCACSLGYAKALHDDIFGCDTTVTLIQSVITGADTCIIRIHIN